MTEGVTCPLILVIKQGGSHLICKPRKSVTPGCWMVPEVNVKQLNKQLYMYFDISPSLVLSISICNVTNNRFNNFFQQFESESESEAESGNKENGGHRSSAPHSAHHSDRSDQSDVEMAPSPEMSDPPTPPPKLPPYLPALQGCRSVDDFTHLNRIEEGTYGVVFRAEDRKQSMSDLNSYYLC